VATNLTAIETVAFAFRRCGGSDGTFVWDSTTMVAVEVSVERVTGLGYTNADRLAAIRVRDDSSGLVAHADIFVIRGYSDPASWPSAVASTATTSASDTADRAT